MNTITVDTMWLIFASTLVLIMQAGFLCLETGLTRAKNNINVAIKNLIDFVLSMGVYFFLGMGIAFNESFHGLFGIPGWITFSNLTFYQVALACFYGMFCSTAATIISGAVAERTKFNAFILVVIVVTALVYPVVVHWCWALDELQRPVGILRKWGMVDFAGGSVVHSVGGWASFYLLIIVGPRRGRFEKGKIWGSNLPLSILGVIILWVGWVGFNGGSVLHFNQLVPVVILNTLMGGVGGGLAALTLELVRTRGAIVRIEMIINGVLAGLVAITAGCHLMNIGQSLLIGAMGMLACYGLQLLLEKWRIDDAVGAVPVHLGGGVWGTLAVGILGEGSGWENFGIQVLGVIIIAIWCTITCYPLFRLINRYVPFRVSAQAEEMGLNFSEHHATNEFYPLIQLMQQQKISGDFTQKAPVEAFTEAGEIAQNYNLVLDKLEKDHQQLIADTSKLSSLGLMASEIIHDLKSPLQLIEGSLYIINNGQEFSPELVRKNLEKINLASHRIGKTLELFLNYVRNSDQDSVVACSLNDIISNAREMHEFNFNKYKIKVEVHLPNNIVIQGRPNQLIRIFLNLFSNATKALINLPDRWIKITAIENQLIHEGNTLNEQYVAINFIDSGTLSTPEREKLNSLLNRPIIQQGQKADTPGLGLAIIRAITESHQGFFRVAMDGVHTQFQIILPRMLESRGR